MNQTSLKQNFAYKALLTIANPIMGIITFPYISRVLGVENIGLVNFVDNTINYFLLFASMGIGSIGVRAIAAEKSSQNGLDKAFSNLLGLNLMFTLIVLFVYNILIGCIPRFNQYNELFYIGNAKILFTSLLIEWFFNGIENFKYVTIRTLLVRSIYVILVFTLIRESNDYLVYFILTTSVIVFNAIINVIYSQRFVKIDFKELFSLRFLKENVRLGIYSLMTSMYLTFNVMYLGLVCGNIEVGYYTSAFKLYYLILSVFTAFTSVMLPRMSSLLSQGNHDKISELLDKSFTFVALFAVPLITCGSILAPELIELLCGKGYEGSVLPMRIIMPAIVLVGIAQVLAIQILMPKKKDNVLLSSSIIGASVSLLLNIILVPHLKAVGSSIVLLTSELVVTLVYIYYVYHNKMITIPWKRFINPILTTFPCILVCMLSKFVSYNTIVKLLFLIPITSLVYIILNYKKLKSYLLTTKQS